MTVPFWQDRRVFVTGHTGFKGSWLCLLLESLGAKVGGYALAPPTKPSLFDLADAGNRVESVTGDVRDAHALSAAIARFAPEVVIHMAAQSVVLDAYAAPVETYATNVMGTVHLLEAIRRWGRPVSVVNVTTDKCYENRQWPWPYRESDRLGGHDPYSNSKACSELVTHAYRQSYFPVESVASHGVGIASARAGNVIGGGDWTPHQLVPAVVAAFSRGEPVRLRHPEAIRPWQHVLDCLWGYLAVAEGLARSPDRCGGEWNFGPSSDDIYTVAQVADTLARHWRVSPSWSRDPGEHPPEALELRLDASKARRVLGWQPRLSTATALEWVAEWYVRTQRGDAPREVCEKQIESFLRLGASDHAALPAAPAPGAADAR